MDGAASIAQISGGGTAQDRLDLRNDGECDLFGCFRADIEPDRAENRHILWLSAGKKSVRHKHLFSPVARPEQPEVTDFGGRKMPQPLAVSLITVRHQYHCGSIVQRKLYYRVGLACVGSSRAREAPRSEHRLAMIYHGNIPAKQVGNGSQSDALLPTTLNGVSNAYRIGAGDSHTCMVRLDGSVWCWGSNASGALGSGSIGGGPALLPAQVIGTSPK